MRKMVILGLVVLLLTGCATGGVKPVEKINASLTVTGFPTNYRKLDSYYIIVMSIDAKDRVKVLLEAPGAKIGDELLFNMEIDSNADWLVVYLCANEDPSSVLYYWTEPIAKSKTKYGVYYWLAYSYSKQKPSFGICEAYAIDYTSDMNLGFYLDFDLAPYYLLKIPNVEDELLHCYLQANEGRIIMEHCDMIPSEAERTYTYSVENDTKLISLYNFAADYSYLILRPGDYLLKTTGVISFGQCQGLRLNERLTKFILCDRSDLVLGYNIESGVVYYINPLTKELEGMVQLPIWTRYYAMDYCKDGMLYFFDTSGPSWHILVLDVDAQEYLEFEIDNISPLRFGGIAAAPQLERLFIVGENSLHMVDTNSYEVISSLEIEGGSRVYVDQDHEKLYLLTTDPYRLFRYNIEDDQFSVEEVLPGGSNFLAFSHDMSNITLYINNRIKTIAADDFTKVLWSSDYTNRIPSGMTQDGRYFYGVARDYVYILDKNGFENERKIPFSFSWLDNVVLTNDNTYILAQDDTVLYFVDTFLEQQSSAVHPMESSYREIILQGVKEVIGNEIIP